MAAAPRHERVAVIDLGPELGSADVLRKLHAAIVAAGFDPVTGDGIEDALAGRDVDRDAVQLAAALAAAQRAFGELRCHDVTAAVQQAIGLAAARQAARRPVPELPRALALSLLCADRENRIDAAFTAAKQLRALGGSSDVPASVWAKYPEVDALANRELVELEVTSDVPGAAIWVDFQEVGVSPLRVVLPVGEHVLAAAAGSKRGWAAGTAVRAQKSVHVPLYDTTASWSALARRVAGWNGQLPAPGELAWVLGQVRARVAIVRRGDAIEAWGQVGRAEPPHRLGQRASDSDGKRDSGGGVASIAELDRVVGVIANRVDAWNARAPDPDQPLLVEPRGARGRADTADPPTKWWVYAAIAGAAAIGASIIYLQDSAGDRQRVELNYP